ncbi:hypothetical protein Shyhy01_07060 [Streptomyces hygroscopicus subsp. hygroscopicus]|uniref:DUF397 domain-containing protein n=1 Tax=Streptomyces sp. KHY 26 TaxID=3097359 RepID=UPI0024A2DB32|nr:DUF397 domain-containing protein [Streptomyces hygroscopicus]GLX47756.1 hypothetical protein Shyhy01_07060 [Streptomyces hygroscopicus subsp. hygroscopicus]
MSAHALQFKPAYSSGEGGACLEVAVARRKSRHSGREGGVCVEVAPCARSIRVRDSTQHPAEAPALRVGPLAWAAFTSSVK